MKLLLILTALAIRLGLYLGIGLVFHVAFVGEHLNTSSAATWAWLIAWPVALFVEIFWWLAGLVAVIAFLIWWADR